jgi:uncharacterized protein
VPTGLRRAVRFEEFIRGITEAVSRFPGHMRTNVFRPPGRGNDEWRVMFTFDSQENLGRWEVSEERRSKQPRPRSLRGG